MPTSWPAGTDHLTPWEACYRTASCSGRSPRFVLVDGGHIQSIIRPPDGRVIPFLTPRAPSEEPDAWLRAGRGAQGQLVDRLGELARRALAGGSRHAAEARQPPLPAARPGTGNVRAEEARQPVSERTVTRCERHRPVRARARRRVPAADDQRPRREQRDVGADGARALEGRAHDRLRCARLRRSATPRRPLSIRELAELVWALVDELGYDTRRRARPLTRRRRRAAGRAGSTSSASAGWRWSRPPAAGGACRARSRRSRCSRCRCATTRAASTSRRTAWSATRRAASRSACARRPTRGLPIRPRSSATPTSSGRGCSGRA